MRVVDCNPAYTDAMLTIFNDAILHSTALYDYKPRTRDTMEAWWRSKSAGDYPVVGVVDESGDLLGFGSFGSFRAWPCYKYTVEHSLYVSRPARRQGVGRLLLAELIDRAVAADYHVLIGAIDSTNDASIALHMRMGFSLVGKLPQVGFKFGDWLDLCFYQRILKTPSSPRDG